MSSCAESSGVVRALAMRTRLSRSKRSSAGMFGNASRNKAHAGVLETLFAGIENTFGALEDCSPVSRLFTGGAHEMVLELMSGDGLVWAYSVKHLRAVGQ
ncbi:hypothetical protein KC350_g83 [Hortaea werneckii]|nr:hypothetical protein KC350_g83 [Hortaea werneckii]